MPFGLYHLLRWIGQPIFRMIARIEILDAYGNPIDFDSQPVLKGPHLLIANHISHFDPPFMAAFYPRAIDFMAMRELFSNPLLSFLFKLCGVFPVDRGRTDSQAARTAVKRLARGDIVSLFPEGGIRTGAKSVLEGAKCGAGAAALAQMASVPVQVVMVIGTDQFYVWKSIFRRPRLYLVYGPVLKIDPSLTPKEGRTRLNEEMCSAWKAMYQHFVKKLKPVNDILPLRPQVRWRAERIGRLRSRKS